MTKRLAILAIFMFLYIVMTVPWASSPYRGTVTIVVYLLLSVTLFAIAGVFAHKHINREAPDECPY